MNFTSYKTPFAKGVTPAEFSEIYRSCRRNGVLEAMCWAERDWVEAGQPYIKVFPAMARMLETVAIDDVPVDVLRPPHACIEICLPVDEYPGSMLVRLCQPQGRLMLQVVQQKLPGCFLTSMVLDKPSIGECIVAHEPHTEAGQRSAQREALSVGVSVLLFMSDHHRLVCPDLEPRLIHGPRRGKQGQKRGKMIARAASLTLGREIELPRPVTDRDSEASGGGPELSHSHVRRAHLAYRRCGPNHSERRLVFIMPTVVRPDLPASPSRPGYFIPDRKEVAA